MSIGLHTQSRTAMAALRAGSPHVHLTQRRPLSDVCTVADAEHKTQRSRMDVVTNRPSCSKLFVGPLVGSQRAAFRLAWKSVRR